jgi:predicted GNAT family N-acyltransferase
MTKQAFRVSIADYARDLPLLRAVRELVFVVEQRVPIELEWDELDPQSVHALAYDVHGDVIGTGRLTPLHTIGRMAVMPAWRGRGVGAALLEALMDKARSLGYPAIELHAQVDAIAFYERYGFHAYGEEYDEAGIRHRNMRRELTG